jgi:hypothetical protein
LPPGPSCRPAREGRVRGTSGAGERRKRAIRRPAFGADTDYTALSVALTAEAGEHTVTITQYVGEAGWRPFYDLNLTRKDGDALAFNRSVLVTQYTGEDWSDVALTLSSSAQPSRPRPRSTVAGTCGPSGPRSTKRTLLRKSLGRGAGHGDGSPHPDR